MRPVVEPVVLLTLVVDIVVVTEFKYPYPYLISGKKIKYRYRLPTYPPKVDFKNEYIHTYPLVLIFIQVLNPGPNS